MMRLFDYFGLDPDSESDWREFNAFWDSLSKEDRKAARNVDFRDESV